jgi:hypothetical protein
MPSFQIDDHTSLLFLPRSHRSLSELSPAISSSSTPMKTTAPSLFHHLNVEPHHPPCCSTRRRGSVGSRTSHRFTPGRPGLQRRLCHRVRPVRGDHARTCRAPFWRGPGIRHFDVGRPGCLWPWVGPPCPGLHDISANDSLWAATPRAALGQITTQHHFNLFSFLFKYSSNS